MADRSKKISELTALTSPSPDDLLVIVDSPAANAVTMKVTVGNLLTNSSSNVTIANTKYLSANNLIVRRKQTPNTSSDAETQGTIFYDDNYLYVVTSNGTIKRIALTSF
jgi:hypothetical protein